MAKRKKPRVIAETTSESAAAELEPVAPPQILLVGQSESVIAELEPVAPPQILLVGQQVVTTRQCKARNLTVPAGTKSVIEGSYTQEPGRILYKIFYRRIPVWVSSEDLEAV